MFKKLFRRDFTSILKLWAIFVGVCITGSVVAALSLRATINSDYYFFDLGGLMTLIGYSGMMSLPVATTVLIIKNFAGPLFTTRGYLTFMLPVKRSTIFKSKIVVGCVYEAMNLVVYAFVLTIFAAVFARSGYNPVMSAVTGLWHAIFNGPTMINVIKGVLISSIILIGEYASLTFIYAAITEFVLVIKPGGAKRVAWTIILLVVGFYMLMIFLLISLLADVFSSLGSGYYDLSQGTKLFYDVVGLASVTFATACLGAIFTLRPLYLIENRLNLR